MTIDISAAQEVITSRLAANISYAADEYHEFLRSFKEVASSFEQLGVTFDFENDRLFLPEFVVFGTLLGEILMTRSFVLQEKNITVAVVFTDMTGDGAQRISRKLWSAMLGLNGHWTHRDGVKMKKEPGLGTVGSYEVISAIKSAIAAKLTLDTAAVNDGA